MSRCDTGCLTAPLAHVALLGTAPAAVLRVHRVPTVSGAPLSVMMYVPAVGCVIVTLFASPGSGGSGCPVTPATGVTSRRWLSILTTAPKAGCAATPTPRTAQAAATTAEFFMCNPP